MGAAGPHDRGPKDTQVGNLVRESRSIYNAGIRILTHACPPVGVGGETIGRRLTPDDLNGSRLLEPLLGLLLGKKAGPPLILLHIEGDPTHRKSKWIFRLRIKVKAVVLIGKSGGLGVYSGPAVCVVLDEGLPARAPARRHSKSFHPGGLDGMALGTHEQVRTTNEAQPCMVEVVIGPVIHSAPLGRPYQVLRFQGKSAVTPPHCDVWPKKCLPT